MQVAWIRHGYLIHRNCTDFEDFPQQEKKKLEKKSYLEDGGIKKIFYVLVL